MIRSATKNDSISLAKLHIATLNSSFLAGLGLSFLSNLYLFLIIKEKVWVYEESNEVKGFVSFSENSSGMMKRFLYSCPKCIFFLILRTIIQPTKLKRFVETFRAPFKSNRILNTQNLILPSAELLSISVMSNCQVSGVGSQLIKTLEDYLLQNRISQYKVIVGIDLHGANRFYIKNGFILFCQIQIHGLNSSNIYIKQI